MAHIQVRNLSKSFNLDREHRLGLALNRARHTVLKDISFDIRKGECVGIIGKNGSGKSTLLRLLAGILVPDVGKIRIEGRILPLIDLQTGINDELSGRENIFLKGLVHGLTRDEVQKKLPGIVTFSGLEEFIDVKVKQYSAGMSMRLAFSIAMEVPHDILLIDEIMAVGDEEFKNKCNEKFRRLRLQGKTFIIVSHNMEDLLKECDRIIFLDQGKIVAEGSPAETIQIYLDYMAKHHLCDMRQNITQKMKELESLRQKTGLDIAPAADAALPVGARILEWWRGKANPRISPEETLAQLRFQIEEFESLIESRMKYLEEELLRLQALASKQRHHSNTTPSELMQKTDYVSLLSKREGEFRRMLDEQQFLLKMKIQLGLTDPIITKDQKRLKNGLEFILRESPPGTGDNKLREMYLQILESELSGSQPVELLAISFCTYGLTCYNLLKSVSNKQARTGIVEDFLLIIEQRIGEAADKGQLWVIERLLEGSREVFQPDSLLPEEGGFLSRYIGIFKEALLRIQDQSATRKRLEELAHILRESIYNLEQEQLTLSSRVENDPEPEAGHRKLARLVEVKNQLFTALSGLYTPFRTSPISEGEGWGFGDVEISRVLFHSSHADGAFRTREQFTVSIGYRVLKELSEGIRVGLTIHHKNGLALFSTSTTVTDKETLKPGVENTVRFNLNSLPLLSGIYSVSVGIYDLAVTQPYDHRHRAYEISVVTEGEFSEQGILDLDHQWHAHQEAEAHLRP